MKLITKTWFVGTLCTLLICLSLVAHDGRAFAQSNSLSPEGIKGLIKSLQRLGADGVDGVDGVDAAFGAGLLPQSDSELDRVRQRAARELGANTDDPRDSPRTKIVNQLSATQYVLVERFCRGEAESIDSALLRAGRAYSRLEQEYCRRAREVLFQYGYEVLDGRLAPDFLLNGAVRDDYVVGRGDELIVNFRGGEARTLTTRVDREGRVVLPDFSPIQASGITFGALRDRLEAATKATFIGTEVFLSLGSLRRISVLVAGEVALPGVQQLTSETTLLDALGLAGGVLKSGSLRRLQVIRQGETRNVDLYDLLAGFGDTAEFSLSDGDRIIVPAVGNTVAVAGDVARPGIFEMRSGQEQAALGEILEIAGNTLRPRGNRFTIVRASERGGETIIELARDDAAEVVVAGDLLLVDRLNDIRRGGVELAGHVRLPGRRAQVNAQTISQLIAAGDNLLPTSYLPLAALRTFDASSATSRLFPISLNRIVDRTEDFLLRESDQLIVFGLEDIRFLSSQVVQSVLQGRGFGETDSAREFWTGGSSAESTGGIQAANLENIVRQLQANAGAEQNAAQTDIGPNKIGLIGICKSVARLGDLIRFSGTNPRFQQASFTIPDQPRLGSDFGLSCPIVFEQNPELLAFLLEYGAVVKGEVRRPGVYPVGPGSKLDVVLAAAGGLTRNADLNNIERSAELTGGIGRERINVESANLLIEPGNIVRVNPVFSEQVGGQIRLVGEVVQPGPYSIRRGEKLSEVLARAGGLTRQAYSFGAIFTRESVKFAEQDSLQRLARELNAAVTVAAANRGIDPNAVTAFARLTRDISESPPTGRVVIESDPVVLSARAELDIALEPGDQLYVPRRPNSVLVTGDVLNPGAMQFVSGKNVDTYIRQAGGFQQSADRNRIFVVLPNGVAQPVSVSAFNFSVVNVPPGSAIVVPKDATPFNAFTIARELSAVLSQLAITAASLAVISNN